MSIERSAVSDALKKHDGNISRAAEELGSSRRTVQLRMKSYGMPPGKAGRPQEPLPYARERAGDAALLVLALLGIGGVAYVLWKSGDSVGGSSSAEYLSGTDVLAACAR